MSIYFPSTIPRRVKKGKLNQYKGINIRWWGENNFFQYDKFMVSAHYGMEECFDFREKYELPRKNFVFAVDSGGFQNLSKGSWNDPIEVIRWQEHNADVAFGLDCPPPTNEPVHSPLFQKYQNKSQKNYEKMVKNRSNDNFEFLLPIQGFSPEALNSWFDGCKDLSCDGYAGAARPVNANSAARTLGFAIDKGFERFHLFMGSGWKIIPVVIYATRFIKNLTFDSSTFSTEGGRYKKYYIPTFIGDFLEFGYKYDLEVTKLPCDCPVCRQIDDAQYLKERTGITGALIMTHNLHVVTTNIRLLQNIVSDKKRYKELIKKRFTDETYQELEFLDLVNEIGFEDAYNKVKRKTNTGIEALL